MPTVSLFVYLSGQWIGPPKVREMPPPPSLFLSKNTFTRTYSLSCRWIKLPIHLRSSQIVSFLIQTACVRTRTNSLEERGQSALTSRVDLVRSLQRSLNAGRINAKETHIPIGKCLACALLTTSMDLARRGRSPMPMKQHQMWRKVTHLV